MRQPRTYALDHHNPWVNIVRMTRTDEHEQRAFVVLSTVSAAHFVVAIRTPWVAYHGEGEGCRLDRASWTLDTLHGVIVV